MVNNIPNLNLRLLQTVNMGAQAGPSNPLKARSVRQNAKKALKSGKAKKISEKHRIMELERAAAEFVSRDHALVCLR